MHAVQNVSFDVKAGAGKIKNFTGIDAPYEAPEAPELRIVSDELWQRAQARMQRADAGVRRKGRGGVPRTLFSTSCMMNNCPPVLKH